MLIRPLKVPPSLLLVLAFCAFLGWHFRHAPLPADSAPAPPLPPPAPPSPPEEVKSHLAAEKKEPQVALVTFITDERSYVHIALRTKDHYARRQGIDLIVDYEAHATRGTVWWKFDMVERLIKKDKWEWIWWLDFDTLITNTEIKVTDIIDETLRNATNPDDIDVLVTHDCNALNLGSFMFRSNQRSIDFIQGIYAVEERAKQAGEHLSEQDSMTRYIKEDSAAADRILKIPQWKLNAFPEEIPCYEEPKRPWEHGYFLVHFAGAWAHVKGDDPTGQLMRKYKDKVIWGDWKQFY